MKHFVLVFAGFLLSTFVLTHTSCKKKDTDCIASITCVDTNGAALSNMSVLLYATVKSATNPAVTYTADLKANGTTDGGGQVKFKFQLPAIYDILATGSIGTKTVSGTGIIKLEEGKTVEKTVTVK